MPKNFDHSFSLRHLASLIAVVSHKQIAAASEQLRKSPSSLARSIDILEEEFGSRLLLRSVAGVDPTPEGVRVAARGRIVERELADLRDVLLKSREATVRANASTFSMHINVSRLRALVAVHDFGSVQRACQVLGDSQPVVSSAIRFLEADLGTRLFSRTSAGMVATPAGIATTLCAKRVLSELRKIRDEVSSGSGVASGQVCVGGLAFSRSTLLPRTIERILAEFPQILVRTIEGPISSLLSGMHAGEIDFIIGAHPDHTLLEGVLVEPIVEDPMCLFVSHLHPLAARKNVTPDEVLAYPFIFPPVGSVTRDLLERTFLDVAGRLPKGMVETSSYTIIRHLLLNSPQIAFRSMSEFETERLGNLVVPLNLNFILPARSICILQRRGTNPTSAVHEVLSAVREEAAGQSVTGDAPYTGRGVNPAEIAARKPETRTKPQNAM